MADVATLGIQIESGSVRRASDDLNKLTKASAETEQASKSLEASLTKATIAGELIGDAIGKGVTSVIKMAESFYALTLSVGDYQDIAERIASDDPAGLASLRTSADVAGTSVASVAQAINRMALQISRSEDSSKGAGKALASIGIEIEKFRQLDGVGQYRALATALDGYADTQAKVQVIQAITGRGGAEQLVMLKELAGETDHLNYLTKEQIRTADAYSDSMKRNASDTRQLISAIGAEGLLPVIVTTTKTITDAARETLGLEKSLTSVAATSHIVRTWATDVALSFADVADYINGSAIEAKKIKSIFEFAFSTKPMTDAMGELKAKMADLNSAPVGGLRKRLEENFRWDASRRDSDPTGAGPRTPGAFKGAIDFSPINAKETKGITEQVSETEKLIATLMKKNAEAKEELATGERLTASQRVRMDIESKLDSGQLKASGSQRAFIAVLLGQADAYDRAAESAKAKAAADKEVMDATTLLMTPVEKYMATLEKITDLEMKGLTSENAARARVKAWTDYEKAINRVKTATSEMQEQTKQTAASIQDALGATMEDALSGHFENIGQIWRGLLIRMAAQAAAADLSKLLMGDATTTGNWGGLIGGIAGLFTGGGWGTGARYGNQDLGGFFADGGDPPTNKVSVVGERGPELFVPKTAGTIIPNGASAGGNITLVSSPTIRIDARSDQAQVGQIVNEAITQSNRQLMEQLHAAGKI